jgi:drug/metabolite transporter (DMT)-like permease
MPYLLLTCAALFWSGNFVLSRGMHAEIPPLALSFWRWSVALAILSLFAVGKLWLQRREARRQARFIIIQGLLGVTGFNTLIYLAVQSTTAINAVLVNSCIPGADRGVLLALLSRRPHHSPGDAGVLTSLVGVWLIIGRGSLATLLELTMNRGDLLVLLAAVLWACYSANLKRYPKELHPYAYQAGIVIVGLAGLTPFYLLERVSGTGFALTPATIATIVYVGLFASVLAFLFWNHAVRSVGPNKAGPFIHLMPVFSTILAVIFLGERLYPYHLPGIALIVTGIILTTYRIPPGKP